MVTQRGGGRLKVEIQEGYPEIEVTIRCPEASEEIRRIESLLTASAERLPCTKGGVTHLVDKHDILYCESVDKRCFIYTERDVFETSLKLYELEELLASAGFIRNAKAQVLNIGKISSLCPDFGNRIEAVMRNGEKLIVSRQYARQLKERLGLK